MKKEHQKLTRKRIFEIIQIGNKSDVPSHMFDIVLSWTVMINIAVTFLLTFEELSKYHKVYTFIEIVTLVLFGIEYILRLITADYLYPGMSRKRAMLKFAVSFDGIVDLFTVVPFAALSGFVVFKLLRIIRLFNLFRINSSFDSFNIIVLVIRDKWKQICFSVMILCIFMLASSLGIYSVEHEAQPEAFANAFSGIWWSMSTMFTVGYGDIYPITMVGQTMAIVLVFLGVGLVAIPTGIISAGFVEQYSYRANANKKLPDISEIGEIRVSVENEFLGRTVHEISSVKALRILLVIRGNMQLIPSKSLILEEDDILVVESEQVSKNAKSRRASLMMERGRKNGKQ